MLSRIPQFCARHPFLVLLVVAAMTYGAFRAIGAWLYVEPDLTKFLPKNFDTIKSDDYYRQNYNHQDFVLVGVEAEDGTVWDAEVLRYMENVILDFRNLRASKTFDSLITGQSETVELPIGIDTEDIQSVANLEDLILDEQTGALKTGRIIGTLKEDLGIPSPPGREDRLPESDEALQRLIPVLREHVMRDPLFVGTLISPDETAAMIQVPMQRKWDFMRRYTHDEIKVSLSTESLIARYKGQHSDFPHDVWGRTFGDITVDRPFAEERVQHMRGEVKAFLLDYYEPVFEDYPELPRLLQEEMTPATFESVWRILEDDALYQNPAMETWETSTNDFYEFMWENIGPFARDNIEFQVYNPRQFVEVGYNYSQVRRILDENDIPQVNSYVAGYEVAIALLSRMMSSDMARLLPLALLVDILVLFVAFRSLRGVVVPVITVFLSMIFAMGTMAAVGVPLSMTTFIIPIVLLAVGTAYGIHILNRYHEDLYVRGGKPAIIRATYLHIGMAVAMAGVTTMAGFSSLAITYLRLVTHFGVFTALGVGYAIVLSFVLTPALLALWPTPQAMRAHLARVHEGPVWKRLLWTPLLPLSAWSLWRGPGPEREPYGRHQIHERGTWLDKILNVFGRTVVRHYKSGLAFTGAVGAVAVVLAMGNYFESGIMYNFKKDNPIRQSDEFINRYLSGTYTITLLFKTRPEVMFTNDDIVADLRQRVEDFQGAWREFAGTSAALQSPAFRDVLDRIDQLARSPRGKAGELQGQLAIVRDILNEEYRSYESTAGTEGGEEPPARPAAARESAGGGEPAESLADVGSLDDLDALGDMPTQESGGEQEATRYPGLDAQQVAGLRDIGERMGAGNGAAAADRFILAVRERKSGPAGLAMQRRFYRLNDIFAANAKQPRILHKLDRLQNFAEEEVEEPQIHVLGKTLDPIGRVLSPNDFVRKTYRVLYHDNDMAYHKIPDVQADAIPDPTATDRAVIGTVMNQAMSSDRDAFNRVVRSSFDEFLVTFLTRAGESRVIHPLMDTLEGKARELFPKDDPYVRSITMAGRSPRSMEITRAIADSQGYSIASGVLIVGLICTLLFRSLQGGVYSMIPLVLTILLNFAVINLLGFAITVSVMMVAAIAIGTGVDYTIHFLERYKIQIAKGDDPVTAYMNTLHTSGKAIVHNAVSVALGFSVLIASDFRGNIQMGILMIGTMAFASLAALTTLPALIFWLKPKFVEKGKAYEVM